MTMSGARRPVGPVVVLLAVVLAVLGVSVAFHGDSGTAAESRGAGAAVDASFVQVVAPVRRVVAEPSPLSVLGAPVLLGAVPGGVVSAVLTRLSGLDNEVAPVLRAARRVVSGDRAPPG
jgi:hypothetical protein